jgi:hypothetical protein
LKHGTKNSAFWVACIVLGSSLATPAFADRSAEVRAYVSNQLASNYAAREIGRNCKSMRAVESKIGGAAMGLKKTLMAKGYTKEEINAGLKGVKLSGGKASGKAMVLKMGAVEGNEASYCSVGDTEIANKTFIGSVLKKK